jgi:CheY-like chemotaxis protein
MATEKRKRAPRVIVVDEDVIQVIGFCVELEARGISVEMFGEADTCLGFVKRKRVADLFVIDIMLPSAEAYSAILTSNYSLTGLNLARDVRRNYPETPILLFSNTANEIAQKEIRDVSAKIGNCAFVKKYSLTVSGQFGELVSRALSDGAEDITKASFWERLKDSIFFKPGFAGVGIDVKALIKQKNS